MSGDIPQTITAPIEPGDTPDEYRDQQIGVLMAHMRHHSAQSAEIVVTQRSVSSGLARLEAMLQEHISASEGWRVLAHERMDTLAKDLATNTEVTNTISEAVNASRLLWRVLKWAAGCIVAIGSAWLVVRELLHSNGNGPGITP